MVKFSKTCFIPFDFRKGKLEFLLFQLRAITSFWISLLNTRKTKKFNILVLWTVIGGRIGYHGWTEICYDRMKLD